MDHTPQLKAPLLAPSPNIHSTTHADANNDWDYSPGVSPSSANFPSPPTHLGPIPLTTDSGFSNRSYLGHGRSSSVERPKQTRSITAAIVAPHHQVLTTGSTNTAPVFTAEPTSMMAVPTLSSNAGANASPLGAGGGGSVGRATSPKRTIGTTLIPPISPGMGSKAITSTTSLRSRPPSLKPTLGLGGAEGSTSAFGGYNSNMASTVRLPNSFSADMLVLQPPTSPHSPADGNRHFFQQPPGQGVPQGLRGIDMLYEPFTGTPSAFLSFREGGGNMSSTAVGGVGMTQERSGTMSTTAGDPARQKMWDHLSQIRALQAEIAAEHLKMDGAGIGVGSGTHSGAATPLREKRKSAGAGSGTAGGPTGRRGSRAAETIGEALNQHQQHGGHKHPHHNTEEENLRSEFEELDLMFNMKKANMDSITSKLRELSLLVRAYHELEPPQLGSTPFSHPPSRKTTKDERDGSQSVDPGDSSELQSNPDNRNVHIQDTSIDIGSNPSIPTVVPRTYYQDYEKERSSSRSPQAHESLFPSRYAPVLSTSPSNSLPTTPTPASKSSKPKRPYIQTSPASSPNRKQSFGLGGGTHAFPGYNVSPPPLPSQFPPSPPRRRES